MIGRWGKDITFFVNAGKQLSFANMNRTSSGRWATHNIVGSWPKMEFLGPGMDEVTMDVVLDAAMGVNPRKRMGKLRVACKKGEVHYLYIGGRKVCQNKVAISKVSEEWDQIWNRGELVRAVVSVTFTEYR